MNRKKFLTSLIIFMGVLILSLATSNVQAVSSKLNLGITTTRHEKVVDDNLPNYDYQYDSNGQLINIWKIVEYNKAGPTNGQNNPTSKNLIYCLRAGFGTTFNANGAFESGSNTSAQAITYSQTGYLKDTSSLSTLKSIYQDNKVFDTTSTEYKALLWLVDNVYIPGESSQSEREKLLKEVNYTDNRGTTKTLYDWMYTGDSKEIINDDITDADIDMIQQLAIWYFTNGDQEAYNNDSLQTIKIAYLPKDDNGLPATISYKTYNEIFAVDDGDDKKDYGEWRFNYLDALYKYFINTAKEKAKTEYEDDKITDAIIYIASENAASEQPVMLITRKPRKIDLSLRKFITAINDQIVESRTPNVYTEKLAKDEETTAIYNHTKDALTVEKGDIITYTIRIYNEGIVDAKVLEIKDYLPADLTYEGDTSWQAIDKRIFKTSQFCKIVNYGGNKESLDKFLQLNDVKTTEELKGKALSEIIIPAYDEKTTPSYIDVQIKCKVTADTEKTLVSIAEITKETSADEKITEDRDSNPNDKLDIPEDTLLPNYTGGKNNGNDPCYDETNVIIGTNGKYYQGQQDDDDFEKIVVKPKEIDLALRKFITEVNSKTLEISREPQPDLTKLKTGEVTNATYIHSKDALAVEYQDVITYTIRVYNEGGLSGYAEEITDNIPEGLQYLVDSETNKQYGWKMIDKDGNPTEKLEEAKYLTTDYLSKEKETPEKSNLIKAYDKGDKLDYKDVKIQFKVVNSVSGKALINIAQISKETDETGTEITKDRDSKPGKDEKYNFEDSSKNEDDIDYEQVKIKQFDMALRKFITGVNDTLITTRVPKVDTSKLASGEAKTATYTHQKTPLEVETGDIITYTIRVYNEGGLSGYAREITDNVPKGLEFIANSTVNTKYGWVMLDKDKKITDKSGEAVYLTTNYLAETNEKTKGENLIKAYDGGKDLDYKDVEIQFKVTYKVTSDAEKGKVLINEAQVSSAVNENLNEEIKDRDSEPGYEPNYNFEDESKNEDDIDYEQIVVRYFDLALKKFITAVNGTPVNNRAPEVKYEENKITYIMKKDPVEVIKGDIVYYTIRVYNEGDLAGYAYEITDNKPEGLQFLVDDEVNKKYGWKMLDKDGKEVEKIEDAVYLTTDYLKDTKLNGFDRTKETSDSNPSYADVQIAFKVVFEAKSKADTERTLINIAQISNDSHNDIDSEPKRDDVYNFDDDSKNEDDIDYEKIKVKYFDLSLLKWVSKTIVTVNGETEEKETGNSGLPTDVMPKVEIKSKEINKVTVKFEYVIKVTNEGQIAGYALEIKDYIPEGLKFEQEDNPDWYEVEGEEGTIATDKIALELLQPGDSREVKVILTWINGTENFGEKVNFAEISKDYNDTNTPDVDSTPNNKVKEEDDIDDAPVILSVKTGQGRIYYMLGATIILTIAGGTFLIKKYVL